jgi:hypothetical protein
VVPFGFGSVSAMSCVLKGIVVGTVQFKFFRHIPIAQKNWEKTNGMRTMHAVCALHRRAARLYQDNANMECLLAWCMLNFPLITRPAVSDALP